MFLHDNFISFHDLSPEARFLWSSLSVQDVLGYTSDELVGVSAYDIINAEDIVQTRVVHKENISNDLVATQLIVRYMAKDGHFVQCVAVFSVCYDFIVNCVTVVHPNPGIYRQLSTHSTAMTRLVGSRKEEFERIKRHHEAFTANRWDMHGMEPEPRVCMILNRFSRNLIIMYASSACERIFHIDPDHIVGKPILLFIRADDLASFVEQMDMIKASTAITHTRFWFQSPKLRQEVPCEAIVFGSADGIVVVMRRCRPFVRKRFIESRDHYRIPSSAAGAAANNSKTRSKSSSWTSACSSSPVSVSSAASSLSMSPLPPQQDCQHIVAADDTNKASSPPHDVPMSRISRLQILDLNQNSDENNTNEVNNNDDDDDNNNNNNNNNNISKGARNTRSKTRPMSTLRDGSLLVKDGLDLPEGFGLKVFNVQDYLEEQDDDEDSDDDIDDHGVDSDSRSNTRQELDMNMDLDIS